MLFASTNQDSMRPCCCKIRVPGAAGCVRLSPWAVSYLEGVCGR